MELSNIDNTAVIIPVYNSEKYLPELLRRLLRICPQENVFAVDDGSEDKSYEALKNRSINISRHETNLGKGFALRTGFKLAQRRGFLYAITIDSDLQHNPEDIPLFIEKQNKTISDLVIGKRNIMQQKIPIPKKITNIASSKLLSITFSTQINDSQSGFRLYNLNLIKDMKFRSKRYQIETEILINFIKKQATIEHIPIEINYSGQKCYIAYLKDIIDFINIYFHEVLIK